MFFWKKKEVKMKKGFKVGDIVYLKDDTRCEPYMLVRDMCGGICPVIRIKNLSSGTYKLVSEDCICKLSSVTYDRNPYDDVSITDKPKLKVKLYNKGSTVIFQVLEQSPSIIGEFLASNGVVIYAGGVDPLVSNNDICLGANRISSRGFNSEKEAEEYVRKALEALQEFADNNYFQGNKENIYEF